MLVQNVRVTYFQIFFQTLYDAWFISFYNVFFTSAPVVFLAVLDQVGILFKLLWGVVIEKDDDPNTSRKSCKPSVELN